jgi:hypothetical protein
MQVRTPRGAYGLPSVRIEEDTAAAERDDCLAGLL